MEKKEIKTTIMVDEKTRNRLVKLKYKHKFVDYNEIIEKMLDKYEKELI